jgi:hypothetical protein
VFVSREQPHRGWIRTLNFTPDGSYLVSGSEDTTLLVWKMTELVPPNRPAGPALAAAALEEAWTALADEDPAKAYRAACVLVESEQVAAALRDRLRPVPKPDAAHRTRVTQFIADLGDERFAKRDQASRELEAMGELAEGELRRALLRGQPPPEQQRRIELLLQKLDDRTPSPNRLRLARAVEVLGWSRTREAKQLLEDLAQGAAESRLTKAALATLQRLVFSVQP